MTTASPLVLYLGRLAPNSRRSIASQLTSIANMLDWPPDEREQRFHQIDYSQACYIKLLLQQSNWSVRSINRALSAIRSIVKVAVLTGEASESQFTKLGSIKLEKASSYNGHALEADHVEKLFNYLEKLPGDIHIRNRAMFACLLGLGLRRSELSASKLGDLGMGKQTFYVPKGKGNKSRTTFIPPWCAGHLDAWLAVRGTEDGPLFNTINKASQVDISTAISAQSIYKLVRKTLSHLGIDNVSPHDLRRTFITRLLEQNVDINTVRQMAGHEDISTTVLYDKRSEVVMQQAAMTLDYRAKRGRK